MRSTGQGCLQGERNACTRMMAASLKTAEAESRNQGAAACFFFVLLHPRFSRLATTCSTHLLSLKNFRLGGIQVDGQTKEVPKALLLGGLSQYLS